MILAGLPVPNDVVQELVVIVREAAELWRDLGQSGVAADELADRLEGALETDVKLLALTIEERGLMLGALEDPPEELAELRAVLLNEHESLLYNSRALTIVEPPYFPGLYRRTAGAQFRSPDDASPRSRSSSPRQRAAAGWGEITPLFR